MRRVVTAMIAAHSAPFHRMLTRELDELGRLDSIQSTIDARGIDAVLSFLEARRDELAVPDLELAAFILVRTVDLLTHAAVTDRPSILEGDVLATELSAIVLGYLVGGRAPRSP